MKQIHIEMFDHGLTESMRPFPISFSKDSHGTKKYEFVSDQQAFPKIVSLGDDT